MNTIADNIKKRKSPNDVFYTPIELVRKHLNYVVDYVDDGDVILDGFYGCGNYFNMYKEVFTRNNKYDYCEIELGIDFFEYNKRVNMIISNPPYSLIDKVLEHSVKLKPHTITYLIGLHNLTNKRIEFMNKHNYFIDKLMLTKVFKWFGMSCIVVFTNKVKTNCIDYDRIVWK